MPRQEPKQLELFEVARFLTGSVLAYLNHIPVLVGLLPESEADIGRAILHNVALVHQKEQQLIAALEELGEEVGYKYFRDEG